MLICLPSFGVVQNFHLNSRPFLEHLINGYTNYANYLWFEITHPGWHNFFYWFLVVSAFFMLVEWARPWRENQARFRKDFWLDFFYMFFNLFLFSLIIYQGVSEVVVNLFTDGLRAIGIENLVAINVQTWPVWAHLLLGFVVGDFISWWIHRLLHSNKWLWEFHKVHHSVEEMGFAAHLRYHWMENVVYATLRYIPLALIGIGLNDFFIIYVFNLAVGHYNHSNITVSGTLSGAILGTLVGLWIAVLNSASPEWLYYLIGIAGGAGVGALLLGPYMKIIFNSPEMHIWHHAQKLPAGREQGMNFGITLSLWDYLFGTAYVPESGRDIKLGFPGIEKYPKGFFAQITHGFGIRKQEK